MPSYSAGGLLISSRLIWKVSSWVMAPLKSKLSNMKSGKNSFNRSALLGDINVTQSKHKVIFFTLAPQHLDLIHFLYISKFNCRIHLSLCFKKGLKATGGYCSLYTFTPIIRKQHQGAFLAVPQICVVGNKWLQCRISSLLIITIDNANQRI